MSSLMLTCHPSTPCKIIPHLRATVHRKGNGILNLTYSLAFQSEQDSKRLLVPDPRPPNRADRLWEHTCFEAFLAEEGLSGYYELNFAPSTEWALYRFEAYRSNMSIPATTAPPTIVCQQTTQGLELDATISLAGLSETLADAGLRLALSAVIEDREGSRSYWALQHPPAKPDFHHPDSFLLRLDQADNLMTIVHLGRP